MQKLLILYLLDGPKKAVLFLLRSQLQRQDAVVTFIEMAGYKRYRFYRTAEKRVSMEKSGVFYWYTKCSTYLCILETGRKLRSVQIFKKGNEGSFVQ